MGFSFYLEQWCQSDPVKGRVAAGFHSNQGGTHLIQIRCVSFQPRRNTPDLDQVCFIPTKPEHT